MKKLFGLFVLVLLFTNYINSAWAHEGEQLKIADNQDNWASEKDFYSEVGPTSVFYILEGEGGYNQTFYINGYQFYLPSYSNWEQGDKVYCRFLYRGEITSYGQKHYIYNYRIYNLPKNNYVERPILR